MPELRKMNKIKEQLNRAKLLALKALGRLDESGEQELDPWLEQDGKNQALQNDILNGDNFDSWHDSRKKIDLAGEWQTFLLNMKDRAPKGRVVRMRPYYIASAVAAVLVVGILTYNFLRTEESYPSKFREIPIAAGTKGAELILSTGQTVQLGLESADTLSEGNVTIANTQGVVSYKSADDKKEETLQFNTLRIPRGGEYQLELSDGTNVWLNSESELVYPVAFGTDQRVVQLKGEAYFDVSPDKNSPFIVQTVNQELKVLGTEFNLSAYETDGVTVTTLVEGSVMIAVEDKNDGAENKEVVLRPEEQVVLENASGNIIKNKVQTYLYTSWKDGRFVFEDTSLEAFLTRLARWYDVEVVIEDESLKDIHFTGDLPRYNDMNSILKILEAEMSVNIRVGEDRIVYISK